MTNEQLQTRVRRLEAALRETREIVDEIDGGKPECDTSFGMADCDRKCRSGAYRAIEVIDATLADTGEGRTDTERLPALLDTIDRQQAEIAALVDKVQEHFDYYMAPEACGDFTCDCGNTEVCGLCEMRVRTTALLANLSSAAEAYTRRVKAEAWEELVSEGYRHFGMGHPLVAALDAWAEAKRQRQGGEE